MSDELYVSPEDVSPALLAIMDQGATDARGYVETLVEAQRTHVTKFHDGDPHVCHSYCTDQVIIELVELLDCEETVCVMLTMLHELAR